MLAILTGKSLTFFTVQTMAFKQQKTAHIVFFTFHKEVINNPSFFCHPDLTIFSAAGIIFLPAWLEDILA
jgi:hypothetical protein